MIRNYIVTALRNLYRNKANTTINVLGLTLGITCSLVIFLIVRFELSFNKHFEDADRVFRIVTQTVNEEGQDELSTSMQFPFVKLFKSDFEDIPVTFLNNNLDDPSIFVEQEGELVRYQESSYNTAFVHEDYPQIFSHEWLAGNPQSALKEINSIVITRKMAMKYFNRTDVVGQTLRFNEDTNLQVTGVIEDYPKASDIPLDLIISIETHKQYARESRENWDGNYSGLHCFVKLPEGVTQESLEARMQGFDEKHRGEKFAENYDRLLRPLLEMHYATNLNNFSENTISKNNLLAVGTIGILLLFAACMNFVNLNTALALKRAKEVGVRKVLGGSRIQLFSQFMSETLLITLVALLISFGGVELVLIKVRNYLGYDLDFSVLSDTGVMLFLGLVLVFSVLFSGLYPSLIMSSYKPVEALKNKVGVAKGKGVSLRKVLVTFQLAISQALIICTVLVVRQMDHFYNTPLGLDPESVVEVYVGDTNKETNELFRTRASQIPGVDQVTFSNTGSISNNLWAGTARMTLDDEEVKSVAHVKFIDDQFLDTYGITLLEGDNVMPSENGKEFLVNEIFLDKMGIMDDPIGMPLSIWGRQGYIKGVVANYNTQSLHNSMAATVMVYETGYSSSALKLKTADLQATVTSVEALMAEVYPDRDLNINFLDETIANFYSEEQKVSTLFQIAAGVAIFIGCIGMVGLISYMASRKIKEVGIRKVLGATIPNILLLFSRQFITLTLLGFALAAPVAYYLMNNWLQNYEYQVNLGAGTFALSLVTTLVLVVISIGYRAYHSASVNPVKSLRSE